jgi:DDE superfamily endonuclease
MEDVLDLYMAPADPRYPLVCLDETSKQLIGESRSPLPAMPGQPERFDYEYVRHGVQNLFMFFAPLHNWRHVKVTERRTKDDWAACMRDLVDVHFPEAIRIRVVEDHLNTHTPAALYEALPPAEAKRILDRLEFHYTPKHGSWLNMAEIELSVLNGQCLDRRIADKPTLEREVAAWEKTRNERRATVNWRFTSTHARIKLKRLYPSIEP